MKTILIFEPLSGGHRANFIRWLSDAIVRQPPPGFHFIFVTDPGVEIPPSALLSTHKIDPEFARHLKSCRPAALRRALRRLFDECVAEHAPDHVLILELTRLELSFALRGAPCPVSAILFVQYPELLRRLKFFLKEWKTALMLKRAPVRNLFLLNGEKSCRYLTDRFGSRTRFIAVPDPVPRTYAEAGYELRKVFCIDSARKIFLFFGAVSPRKGADVLLKALELLPASAARKSAFIFCGEPECGYRTAFETACSRLYAVRPDIDLKVDNRFVQDERMTAMFEQSDVILMPYIRPEYSSGVLAIAARCRKPVIGPDSGLLGRLIRENGLGTVCSVTADSVAAAVADAAENPPVIDHKRCEAFTAKSCPDGFARTILTALIDA